MISFEPVSLSHKALYRSLHSQGGPRGCEYSFANLYLWGRQQMAPVGEHMALFSQFSRRTVYPFPVGGGDKGPVLEAILRDARERGIPCRITGLSQEDMALLEALYPGRFRFHCDRDSYDYVYKTEDLADLKGRRYQKKRNHYNRFWAQYPQCTLAPLDGQTLPAVREMAESWYVRRAQEDPLGDYHMEHAALKKALDHCRDLDMVGLVLLDGDRVLAFTLGSPLGEDTLDVHFEKALPQPEEAYAVINCEFARFVRRTRPEILYLNREDDLGIPGLRRAKESYGPHHMVEKCWACLLEDGYDY